jgi:hypothetical protein
MESVDLSFAEEALGTIARKVIERKTRLCAIMESILLDTLFDRLCRLALRPAAALAGSRLRRPPRPAASALRSARSTGRGPGDC